jgi:hypothetical protein
MKYIFVLFFINQFVSSFSFAQSISAGQHSVSDYYFDFSPDVTLNAVHNGASVTFPLDMNNDGITDFEFFSSSGGGLGGSSSGCTIFAKGNNEIAWGFNDSCFGNPNNPGLVFVRKLADTIQFAKPIDSALVWEDSLLSLAYYSFNLSSHSCSENAFASSGSVFAGVRVFTSFDTLYGWIKVNTISATSFTIEEFACNKGVTGISENEKTNLIDILPNPAVNEIQVNLKTEKQGFDYSILDGTGRIVKEGYLQFGNTTLSTEDLTAGVYYMKIGNLTSSFILQK